MRDAAKILPIEKSVANEISRLLTKDSKTLYKRIKFLRNHLQITTVYETQQK
ncbi:MAG: hypothetical protein LBM19_03580 [Holosporales bacterium]|nr:hypothetical protein [Holosporales bacterium]